MKRRNLYIGVALAILSITACKPTLDEFTPSAGTKADFSKYIAIGNSLSAGFADGGLYLEGQKVAFPLLIAEQLQKVGGGEFKSPFFSEEQSNGSGYIRLKALVNGQPVTEQVADKLAYRSATPKLLIKYTEPINNLGVPGMRMDMAFAPGIGTAAGNMYFERLLPDGTPPTMNYFTYSTTQNHTFFTFSLGNNDVLGYATNGAVNEGPTTTLTSTALFNTLLNNYVGTLTAKGQKGVLATIPDVTSVPYFTTVTRQVLLAAVNAASTTKVTDIYIATKTGPRAATDQDFFVLPFSSAGLLGVPNANKIPYGLHPLNPVEDKYVLDTKEAAEVVARVNDFNKTIKSVAASKGLAVADVNAFLTSVKNGIRIDGLAVSAKYITGNGFSLDGIHLTPIGNALMANVFIEAINKTYGAQVPRLNISDFRGVKLP
ncbi:G-D-S-L family lipolytic protein [Sphingobacterium sp. PCS056]|uniref:G-D-S-L family lipolytic protein n=1 Tax=Sphingobacterium sp. PCS056 TaxID=2931400 RepID=UPI000B9C34C7|nr:G-D-S-L family lipolytic protein [Sphingobacterium sp. PCS056]UPZ38206.1 G-D-S-L family lipolytic protein [Sphingobacterium sp. PCS056]HCU44483.1 G-D-S-L family lipolytic protein [Sphingobacterium sp.]